jgi:hypothetical protein
MSPTAERVMGILRNARLPLEDEKQLQEEMWGLLRSIAGNDFRMLREQTIAGGRIDFVAEHVSGLTGIEVKVKGGKREIFRQLCGYCEDGRLAELIVATSLPLALPRFINGKPVAIVDLGRAWL